MKMICENFTTSDTRSKSVGIVLFLVLEWRQRSTRRLISPFQVVLSISFFQLDLLLALSRIAVHAYPFRRLAFFVMRRCASRSSPAPLRRMHVHALNISCSLARSYDAARRGAARRRAHRIGSRIDCIAFASDWNSEIE